MNKRKYEDLPYFRKIQELKREWKKILEPLQKSVKLAKPDKQVVAVCGDGDFQMTCQELATAVQYEIPVVYCVLNNYGWLSIRDLQLDVYGVNRGFATEFRKKAPENYTIRFLEAS